MSLSLRRMLSVIIGFPFGDVGAAGWVYRRGLVNGILKPLTIGELCIKFQVLTRLYQFERL